MRPTPPNANPLFDTPSAAPKSSLSKTLASNSKLTDSTDGQIDGHSAQGEAEAIRRALDFGDGDSSLSEAESESEELKRAAKKREREARVAKSAAASSSGRMGGRSMRSSAGGLKPTTSKSPIG